MTTATVMCMTTGVRIGLMATGTEFMSRRQSTMNRLHSRASVFFFHQSILIPKGTIFLCFHFTDFLPSGLSVREHPIRCFQPVVPPPTDLPPHKIYKKENIMKTVKSLVIALSEGGGHNKIQKI